MREGADGDLSRNSKKKHAAFCPLMAKRPPWVHVQQPTVPQYRVPLFDLLNDRLDGRIRVSASPTVHCGPDSAPVRRRYLDLAHRCQPLAGGRAFWQQAMTPLADGIAGDVAVVSGNPRFLSTLRFMHLARQRRMSIVWWGHGHSPSSSHWGKRIRQRLMSHCEAVLLYTDEEAAAWRAHLPLEVGVFGAQNALDQSHADNALTHWTAKRLHEFRSAQALEGRKLLLFCGRLRRQPDAEVEVLLRAVAELIPADPRLLAIVIGDGEERQRLQALAVCLGLHDHVRWLGAQYDESVNAPWFLSAELFVYPGSIGLSILHAMGYGLPVLTHSEREGHNPEIAALRNGWNGLECQRGNARHFAQQIARVVGNPELRRLLSDNARRTVAREFSLASMADRFCAAVEHAREHASVAS